MSIMVLLPSNPSPPFRPEEIWATSSESKTPRPLWDARLFPVFQPRDGAVGLEGVSWLMSGGPGTLEWWRGAWRLSLREVLSLTDQEGELCWREELFFRAARKRATDTLRGHSDHSLLPSIRAAVLGGQQGKLLSTLDSGEEWGWGTESSCQCSHCEVYKCF